MYIDVGYIPNVQVDSFSIFEWALLAPSLLIYITSWKIAIEQWNQVVKPCRKSCVELCLVASKDSKDGKHSLIVLLLQLDLLAESYGDSWWCIDCSEMGRVEALMFLSCCLFLIVWLPNGLVTRLVNHWYSQPFAHDMFSLTYPWCLYGHVHNY